MRRDRTILTIAVALAFPQLARAQTREIAGTVTVAGGRATTADVRVSLLALTSGSGTRAAPQFGISLDTKRYPVATVDLTRPVPLDAASVTATGTLTLHGVTRTVTVLLALGREGADLDVTGRVPVTFGDYGLAAPAGYGPLGSLADRGDAEFLLVLRRA